MALCPCCIAAFGKADKNDLSLLCTFELLTAVYLNI